MTDKKKSVEKFDKNQLLESERYQNRRDLVGALLKDGEQYSIEEVDDKIEKFMKGKVK